MWLLMVPGVGYALFLVMSEPSPSPTSVRAVLIVEDNDVYRQVVCAALQRRLQGWDILQAASLAEAERVVDSRKLDVVVTDLSLPDGSGVDLVPKLARDLERGLRLVALTNEAAQDVLPGLKKRGYHGFVAKEHGIKALCDAVEAVSAGREFVSQSSDL